MTGPGPAAPGARLAIDRLALHAPGLTESDGRRLAALVAEMLARSSLRSTIPVGPADAGRPGSIRVETRAREKEPIERLADRLVDDVLRRLVEEVGR